MKIPDFSPAFLAAQEPRLAPLIDRYEKTGSLHSTILFTGIEGVGKKSLAMRFLQILFCDRREPSPCGKCRSCQRAEQGQWVDLSWFDPEAPEEGHRLGIHKIEAFRDLKTKLGLGPVEEPFRVVVITDADRMTPAAANSILKILEEPPKNWLFLLTASDSSRLLPTIRSRCMELRLPPLPARTIESILSANGGAEANRIRIAARSANGSITRAMTFLGDEVWSLRSRLIDLLQDPSREWLRLIDEIAKTQFHTHIALDLLESILSDLLHHRIRGSEYEWTHADQKDALVRLSESRRLQTPRLCRAIELLAEKRKLVNLTLNSKLLAQEILIPVLEVV